MTSQSTTLPLPISPLAIGTWALAGDKFWGNQAESESVATIHAALDSGITLLDTAPAYGDGLSEEIIGKALRGHRDRALIATKISESDMTPTKTVTSCESSLRRLQVDCIDLLQIHWLGTGEQLEDVIAAMEKLRSEGKVRALGVCNFGPKSMARLIRVGTGWITNQVAYNLLWRAIEFEITDACIDNGFGILCYSPLMQGLLSGRFRTPDDVPEGRTRTRHFRSDRAMSRHGGPGCEKLTFDTIDHIRQISVENNQPMADVALAWLLQSRGVKSVIFGARTPKQIEDNVISGRLKLNEKTVENLDRCTKELKSNFGANPDLWAPESRIM